MKKSPPRAIAAPLIRENRRVEIEWIDSTGEGSWEEEEHIERETQRADYADCVTIGYLVAESEQFVTIAQSFATTSHGRRLVGSALSIPRVAIIAIRPLRRGQ